MAHEQQNRFIKRVRHLWPDHFHDVRVLEIGSLDINGSVRQFWTNSDYLGVDVGPGPGVDVVCAGQELRHPTAHYDVTISTECFEHNPRWLETFQNMIRMTRSQGLVIFTSATTGRPEHGTARTTPQDSPWTQHWDYYENRCREDFERALDLGQWFEIIEWSWDHQHHDLYFWGLRR